MRIASDLADAVGQTPLIKLKKASELTGCTILALDWLKTTLKFNFIVQKEEKMIKSDKKKNCF